MWIGVGRIVLDFFGNDSVSRKKRELEELCVSLRKKFNLSALEITDFEDPEKCVLGFAAVIPENWKTRSAQEFVQAICKTIDETAFTRVVIEDWDLLSHGEEVPLTGSDEGSREWVQQRRARKFPRQTD